MPPARVVPGPGQESVWDYPRPPRVEPCPHRLTVVFAGVTVADTTRGLRLLETSHPPTYYFPPADVRLDLLTPAGGGSVCEYKGRARYFTLAVDGRTAERCAWSYPTPAGDYAALAEHLAFYAALVDTCTVGDDVATPQPGGFYGGWVTPAVVGPFKGGPGSMGW